MVNQKEIDMHKEMRKEAVAGAQVERAGHAKLWHATNQWDSVILRIEQLISDIEEPRPVTQTNEPVADDAPSLEAFLKCEHDRINAKLDEVHSLISRVEEILRG